MDLRGAALAAVCGLLIPLVPSTAGAASAEGPRALGAAPVSRCYPATDNGDPVLTGLDVSPRAVDARRGAQDVTFTVTATDTGGPGAATGVVAGAVLVSFDGTDGWNHRAELRPASPGVLVGTLTVLPQFSTATRYVAVDLEDAAGNTTHYRTDDVAALGIATTFTTTTSNPDTRNPKVTRVELSTTTVDTRSRPGGFRIRVHAADDGGVKGIRVWLWGSPVRSLGGRLRLVSGTAVDGVWAGRVGVPMWQGTTTAKLAIELTDVVDRSRLFGPRALRAIDQPGTVRVVSRDEPQPPSVTVRSASPTTVDLREADGQLVITARVTDRGSGVRRAAFTVDGPEAAQGNSGLDGRMRRVAGTRHAGTWKATVPLDACHETAGSYRVTVFAWDAFEGNYTTWKQTVTVLNTDIRRPSVDLVGDYSQQRRSGPVTIRFDEDVVGIDTGSAQVRVGQAFREAPGDPGTPLAGTWSCTDRAGAAVDCVTGPVRTAAFTPAAPMAAGADHSVVVNPEHDLGVTDLSGNPFRAGWMLGFTTL